MTMHGEFLCYLLCCHHRARLKTKEPRNCAKHLRKLDLLREWEAWGKRLSRAGEALVISCAGR
ncbi:hypothetical protein BN1007_70771 [Klebsiella variicola]|nr:hypothetical protein BN1007_70771 [Klebsiella variicola]CTQ25356.1 hypothetical protein BN1200_720023 [Klebsiella variicola]